MRPIACSTWAFSPMSRASWGARPGRGKPRCFRPPCRPRFAPLPRSICVRRCGSLSKRRRRPETVDQFYVEVAEEDKVAALRRLLQDEPIHSGLVFRPTRHRADRLARAFAKSRQAAVIHGEMREGARLRALRDFESRRVRLLIATNVASRGLDLADVSHVVNYDIPEDIDTYIHRIGRTARAGRPGTAITFVSQYDLEAFDQLRRAIGQALRRHPLNLYDSPRPRR